MRLILQTEGHMDSSLDFKTTLRLSYDKALWATYIDHQRIDQIRKTILVSIWKVHLQNHTKQRIKFLKDIYLQTRNHMTVKRRIVSSWKSNRRNKWKKSFSNLRRFQSKYLLHSTIFSKRRKLQNLHKSRSKRKILRNLMVDHSKAQPLRRKDSLHHRNTRMLIKQLKRKLSSLWNHQYSLWASVKWVVQLHSKSKP